MIVFVFLNSCYLNAQTPVDAYVITTAGANGTVYGFIHVNLPDTISIATIEVKLGSTDGGQELVSQVFVFDANSGLPSGFEWHRNGTGVVLSVGSFAETPVLFGQVRLQNNSSGWGDTYAFVTN